MKVYKIQTKLFNFTKNYYLLHEISTDLLIRNRLLDHAWLKLLLYPGERLE